MNRLQQLHTHGQSVWLDYIRRDLMSSGALDRLITEDGIRGLTSNPAIFEKAIGGTDLYDAALRTAVQGGLSEPEALYEHLAIADIRAAADHFRPLYDASEAADGFVSLEVSPRLAHDADGTVTEALRLWTDVDRPNLMIKVPGTAAGVLALPRLLARGISVNVTLLFARRAYGAIAEAWLQGLEQWVGGGGDARRVASVASFFVSRIDAASDPHLPEALRGQVAIANARAAYADYLQMLEGARWQALKAQGARPQRLLWASTGTKNPAYSDTLYMDALIGPDTVNTVPPATLDAFRDHGTPARTLDTDLPAAQAVLDAAAAAGLDLEAVTEQLCAEGIAQFETAFSQLLAAVAAKRDQLQTA